MQRRIEMGLLGVLVIVLIVVYFHGRDSGAGIPGVQDSSMDFIPLNVQEPELRLDLLEKIQKSTYNGVHRNVFVFGPAPVAARVETPAERHEREMSQVIGPRYMPPPPVDVPAQFFGTAFMEESRKRVAFFQNGEDVLVVPEGDTFLNRFRLIHIGNESADVEEISSGRHAQVPMVPPVTNPTPNQPGAPPQESE
jgi:hypothetical protein